MIIKETKIKDAFLIEAEEISDERGFFARIFCHEEIEKLGFSFHIMQSSYSYNKKKGTVRGMHFQIAPHEEIKIVTCLQGAIYDVIIDLRKDSESYGQWQAFELNSYLKSLIIPKGCAHGFQALEDETLLFYQISEKYHPECSRGIRWNDSFCKITWPLPITVIAKKDQEFIPWNNV